MISLLRIVSYKSMYIVLYFLWTSPQGSVIVGAFDLYLHVYCVSSSAYRKHQESVSLLVESFREM